MGLTHFDENGKAVMVDVTDKKETAREAVAEGKILVNRDVFQAVKAGTVGKGDVLAVAATAGIAGAKRTSDLIPMCHILPLTNCKVDFRMNEKECAIFCTCTVKVTGKTGVEMEALTGVSAALLTIYDMCKALDKKMEITDIRLLKKTGGKSGDIWNDFVPDLSVKICRQKTDLREMQRQKMWRTCAAKKRNGRADGKLRSLR